MKHNFVYDDLHDVIIESDLTIFRDNRPATTSDSGSIVPLPFDFPDVPLPFDDSDFSVDDLPY